MFLIFVLLLLLLLLLLLFSGLFFVVFFLFFVALFFEERYVNQSLLTSLVESDIIQLLGNNYRKQLKRLFF